MMPERLQAARFRLATQRPYLAAALWALAPVERPGLGTLAVDRWWRLYYDPAALTAWSVEEAAGILYHEIGHMLRAHAERADALSAEARAWNLAADAEINDDILAEKVVLPDQPVTPAALGQPEGLLAEDYYAALAGAQAQQAAAQQQAGRSTCEDGAASPSPSSASDTSQSGVGGGTSSSPTSDQVSDALDKGDAASEPATSLVSDGHAGGSNGTSRVAGPRPGAGHCGSCATGRQEPWEDASEPGIGRTEAELVRRHVAESIRTAVSSGRGSIPGHWRRWAEERLAPRVDWRRELAAAVRHAIADVAGAADYSYRRPSRRQVVSRAILPTLRQPVPEVAVVVDTSGSISDQMLARALAEVAGVLRACGLRQGVHVLAVDAQVQTCRRVFRPEQVDLQGGGGTDMATGIAAALRLRPRPQVVVVLTDGDTPWPGCAPAARVVVGLLGAHSGTAPAWARVVKIDSL